MNILDELVSGALRPDIYRCESLEEPTRFKNMLEEKGWRDFYLDGRSIGDKLSLMEAIAKAMSFPAYVANNWDALEEAVRDLEWVPGTGYLVVYDYPQVFAAYRPQEWQMVLSILRSAIAYWRTRDVPMFVLLCKTEAGLAGIPRL